MKTQTIYASASYIMRYATKVLIYRCVGHIRLFSTIKPYDCLCEAIVPGHSTDTALFFSCVMKYSTYISYLIKELETLTLLHTTQTFK